MAINFNIENSGSEGKSFGLLRTNPKLTSNVKLIVNSQGNIFLGSFKSNKTLSQVTYQQYELNERGSYSKDVANFYKGLPSDDKYAVWRKFSDITPYTEYEFQYEDQYNFGASFNATKLYDEQYRILAPIWLDRKVPSKFVIYRVNSVDYDYDYSENVSGQNSRILELLNKATIVKTFDLSQQSKIGKYLHNHVFDKAVPTSPLNFNFEVNGPTEFRGIDINKGGFASKQEFLSKDYIQKDSLEIFANQLVSSGFQRHGLISANLINLEFMFDDPNAINYNIYRYFGLYVDEVQEGSFDVNYVAKNGMISIEPNSVSVNYNLDGTGLTAVDMLPTHTDLEMPVLSYVKATEDIYYHVKNNVSFLPIAKLQINSDNVPEFKGFSKTTNLIETLAKKPSNRGFVKLTVTEVPTNNDRFFIGDATELEISSYDLYDYTGIADSSLEAGTISGNRFSTQGTLQQVAYAISKVIKLYNVYVYGNSIVIEDYANGVNRKRMAVGISIYNVSQFFTVDAGVLANDTWSLVTIPVGVSTSFSDWNIYTTVGGSKEGAAILVSESELGDAKIGQYVKAKDLNKFSRIIDVVQDHYDSTTYRVILNDLIKISNDNSIHTYVNYSPTFGKFSVYPLKDFDFDFYSTDNSDLGELSYEKLRGYQVSLEGASETTVGNNNPYMLFIWDIDVSSQIKVGDFLLSPTDGVYSKIIEIDFDQSITAITTDGPINISYEQSPAASSITVYTGVVFKTLTPVLEQETIKDEAIEIQINSEYDRLYENALKETALESRVVPTIMKFALKDSTNARNKPYILNVSEAFGTDNLSPNIELESGRNPDNFNMEHFHINFIPKSYYTNNTIAGLTSYLDFNNLDEDGTGISEDKLKSTNIDYFSLYFKWSGAYNNQTDMWVDDKLRDMFTKFSNGSTQLEPSTVFRGLRYIYKKRKEFTKSSPTEFINTTEVNDYKFGVVLNYNTTDQNSITYNVVKNDVFKFICVVINLNVVLNSITETGLTRSLMYDLEDITDVNGNILNTLIPFNIDLSLTDWNTPSIDSEGNEYYSVFANVFDQASGNAKFTEYVTQVGDGNYSWIFFDANGDYYGMKVYRVISNNEIAVKGKPVTFEVPGLPTSGGYPIPSGGEIDDITLGALAPNTSFYYWRGGESGWKNLMEDIVSYKFATRFNNFGNIEYVTVTSTDIKYNQFVLEVQDGVNIVKPSILTTKADGDRPKSYKLTPGEIGRVLTTRPDGGYFTMLRRMNGEYMPLFKDVVTFSNIYNEESVYIPLVGELTITPIDYRSNLIHNKFRNMGIAFSSFKEVEQDYGYIKNAFFHKVNDENSKNLLKLSETSDKLPLYPLIGEIAIDKKNINVFKSKYSNDYFTKSLPGGKVEYVHGTLTPVEIRSYLASTVMKVKDTYDITNFTSTKENSVDSLDAIRFNNLNTSGIHWIETDSQIIADFYLPKAINEELREDNILTSFSKYILPEYSYADKQTIEDDLDKYVYSNIVNRFIIDSINIYGVSGKQVTTDFVMVTDPVDLSKDGYLPQTNFDIQGYQNDALSFRLIYNKKIGYGYNLKVHVKIQA